MSPQWLPNPGSSLRNLDDGYRQTRSLIRGIVCGMRHILVDDQTYRPVRTIVLKMPLQTHDYSHLLLFLSFQSIPIVSFTFHVISI
jgi:hypothetical protein